MEKIDKELGKQLTFEHYKVGHWYKFIVGSSMIKYMKVEKIYIRNNQPERAFIKGSGFVVLNDALHIPKTTKEEIMVFCWAKYYNEINIEFSEIEVKEIYKSAMEKSYNNLFN